MIVDVLHFEDILQFRKTCRLAYNIISPGIAKKRRQYLSNVLDGYRSHVCARNYATLEAFIDHAVREGRDHYYCTTPERTSRDLLEKIAFRVFPGEIPPSVHCPQDLLDKFDLLVEDLALDGVEWIRNHRDIAANARRARFITALDDYLSQHKAAGFCAPICLDRDLRLLLNNVSGLCGAGLPIVRQKDKRRFPVFSTYAADGNTAASWMQSSDLEEMKDWMEWKDGWKVSVALKMWPDSSAPTSMTYMRYHCAYAVFCRGINTDKPWRWRYMSWTFASNPSTISMCEDLPTFLEQYARFLEDAYDGSGYTTLIWYGLPLRRPS
ncbi:hypothetical protein MRB53_036872 [Persea americana]|nr:hypothetical protein MRB53_036872 [Persea americana]